MVGERQTGHTNRAYLRSFIGRRKKGNSERPPGKRKREGGRRNVERKRGRGRRERGRQSFAFLKRQGTACPVPRQA